jgi:hypothetical protein
MNQGNVFAAGLLVLGFSAHEASALTIPIPYFDDFNHNYLATQYTACGLDHGLWHRRQYP